MLCPNCQTENRDGAKFCISCGAQIGVAETQPDVVSAPGPVPQPSVDSMAEVPTKPLRGIEAAFAPLPNGALIGEERYEILDCQSEGQKLNVYQAQGLRPFLRCPNPECGFDGSEPGESFCSNCGAALDGASPSYPQFVLKESWNSAMFSAAGEVARLELSHPAIIAPRDFFEETPYGDASRFYLVLPAVEMTVAANLPVPQQVEMVLSWGTQLAHGLEYLHQHHVAHQMIDKHHILVDDQQAKLADFSAAYVVPPAARGKVAPKRYEEDLRMLAETLFQLMTGQEDFSRDKLPDPILSDIFAKALTAEPGIGYQTAGEMAADLEKALKEIQRSVSVDLQVGRLSDVGVQRDLNEDSLLTLELGRVCQSISQPIGLYAVADGMGGHSAGEVASGLAIQVLASTVLREVLLPVMEEAPSQQDYSAVLEMACRQANEKVYEHRRAAGSDMGTTLVAALVVDDTAYIANVGDSRAYLINQAGITQITTDHSLVERLVATGQISREEARVHPQRNVIYRTMGDKPKVDADLFLQRLETGDHLLLCSDGLSGMISDEAIWQTVISSPHPQQACATLVQAAKASGGDDNIAVVIIRVESV
jgi:serine/threonine protein phosphatase PrpC